MPASWLPLQIALLCVFCISVVLMVLLGCFLMVNRPSFGAEHVETLQCSAFPPISCGTQSDEIVAEPSVCSSISELQTVYRAQQWGQSHLNSTLYQLAGCRPLSAKQTWVMWGPIQDWSSDQNLYWSVNGFVFHRGDSSQSPVLQPVGDPLTSTQVPSGNGGQMVTHFLVCLCFDVQLGIQTLRVIEEEQSTLTFLTALLRIPETLNSPDNAFALLYQTVFLPNTWFRWIPQLPLVSQVYSFNKKTDHRERQSPALSSPLELVTSTVTSLLPLASQSASLPVPTEGERIIASLDDWYSYVRAQVLKRGLVIENEIHLNPLQRPAREQTLGNPQVLTLFNTTGAFSVNAKQRLVVTAINHAASGLAQLSFLTFTQSSDPQGTIGVIETGNWATARRVPLTEESLPFLTEFVFFYPPFTSNNQEMQLNVFERLWVDPETLGGPLPERVLYAVVFLIAH